MPRPGPRPYECVRRAWHSDRHQPVRGSIVQQIFRYVNENHSAATRKNKEWQEKLPIVVLKAEEILYSKANSEAEYLDSDTLWDRVNDAINTIIRRDESSETGELLPPCIEAALNLGCVPVRASRSQRHSNPRSYLNPRMHEPVAQPARVLDKPTNVWHQQSLHSGIPLNAERATSTGNLTSPLMGSNCFRPEDSDFPASQGSCNLFGSTPLVHSEMMVNANNKQLNLGCVYPLYYGNPRCPLGGSQLTPQVQENSNSRTIFVGKPVHMTIPERLEMGALQNLFPCSTTEIAPKRIRQGDDRGHANRSGPQCDLSLRLGLFSDSCTSNDRASAREAEDVDLARYKDRAKVSDCSRQNNAEFQFLVGGRVNEPWESCTSRRSSEVEDWNPAATARKRKEPFSNNVEDGQCYWFPNLQLNQFHGQIRGPGL